MSDIVDMEALPGAAGSVMSVHALLWTNHLKITPAMMARATTIPKGRVRDLFTGKASVTTEEFTRMKAYADQVMDRACKKATDAVSVVNAAHGCGIDVFSGKDTG